MCSELPVDGTKYLITMAFLHFRPLSDYPIKVLTHAEGSKI